MMALKSPQIRNLPFFLGTGMIGVAQLLCGTGTFVITPLESSSFSTAALIANRTGLGLKNLGRASGLTCRVAWNWLTVPNSSLKRSAYFYRQVVGQFRFVRLRDGIDVSS